MLALVALSGKFVSTGNETEVGTVAAGSYLDEQHL
jgi:hypothetical protein